MFARKRQAAPTPIVSAEPTLGVGHEALRFLTAQELEHTPANYTLALRAKGDRRSLVAMSVDAILMEGRALTQADADRIMAAEAQRSRPKADTPDPRQDALRHQTLRLADLTAEVALQSSDFGRDLSSRLMDLASSPATIQQVVAAMVHRTREVEAQLVATCTIVETLRDQVETIREDAHRDALTGLFNRRGVLHELSCRKDSTLGLVAMCDVDHFKSINDRFGHAVGDRVLKGVAASITESLGVHVVARWGGEEFLVLIDEVDAEAAVRLLDRARADLAARTFKVSETGQPLGAVTISMGAALLGAQGIDEAVGVADRMLYAAKGNGRNRLVVDRSSGLVC